MQERLCERSDLRVEVIANAYVDDLGQPILDDETDRTAGINDVDSPYFCVGPCNRDFAAWEEALAHLSKVAV